MEILTSMLCILLAYIPQGQSVPQDVNLRSFEPSGLATRIPSSFVRGFPAAHNDPLDDPNPQIKPASASNNIIASALSVSNNDPSDEAITPIKPGLYARGVLPRDTTPSIESSSIFVATGSPVGSPISRHVLGVGSLRNAGRAPSVNQGVTMRSTKVSPNPRTQKSINCSAEGFNVMNECCKEQIGPLFKQDARYKCYNSAESIWSTTPIKEYILNRMYSPVTNKLDLINTKVIRAGEFKFTECIFQAEGLLTTGSGTVGSTILNTAASMANYFKDMAETFDAKVLIQNAVDACLPKVTGLAWNQQRSDVNVLPYILAQCIRREILMTCTIPIISQDGPPKNKQSTFKVFAEQCNNKRNALRSCPIFM